jgi:hypothetical protein
VVLGEYREFLAAIAGSAAALTGLLFVAMSVAPRHLLSPGGHPPGPPEPIRTPSAEATSTIEAGPLPLREAHARPAASTSSAHIKAARHTSDRRVFRTARGGLLQDSGYTAFAFRNSASPAVMPGGAETSSVRVSVPAIEVDALLVPGR